MVRAPCTFRRGDVTRAIRAVEAAGQKIRKVEVDKDGKVVIVIAQDDASAMVDSKRNEWDAEYGPDQTEIR
jgi:hypothetical protein